LAAVPSIGRANRVEGVAPLEADLTRALYEEHANAIFRYCLHQLGSREEAEDAVQSTFLNAFRGIKRGIVPELESAWLFKIAHNVCLSRRRSSWRRGRVESPADFEIVEEIAPAPSRRADELIGLQDVLEQMPEMQRRAILLREWQGLSYREIAEELELSQAAVETLIFRARRSLASGLEQPPVTRKRRIARAADWGNVVTALKSLLVGGSAAAKIAATVAVVSATTVVAAEPVQQHRAHHHRGAVQPRAASHVQASSEAAASPAGGPAPPGTPFMRVARHTRDRIARHKAAIVLVSQPSAPLVAPTADESLSPAPADAQPQLQPEPAPAAQAPAPVAAAPAQPAPATGDKPKDNGNGNANGNGNPNGRFSSTGQVQPIPAQPQPSEQPGEPQPNDSANKGNSWHQQQGGDGEPTQPTPVAASPPISITPVTSGVPTATTPATSSTGPSTTSPASGPLTVSTGGQPTVADDPGSLRGGSAF
jgi:RNA polymerase sigma-70 factor, ECF subfamily